MEVAPAMHRVVPVHDVGPAVIVSIYARAVGVSKNDAPAVGGAVVAITTVAVSGLSSRVVLELGSVSY